MVIRGMLRPKSRLFVSLAVIGLLSLFLFRNRIALTARVYQNDFWRWKYATFDDATSVTYTRVGDVPLKATMFQPEASSSASTFPVIVYFFGGGWKRGSLNQFYEHAMYFRNKGFIAILADYRVELRHQSTPVDAVSDALALIQFLFDSSVQLRIDTTAFFLCGASAGGQLALSTVFDSTAVHRPTAILLYLPVLRTDVVSISPLNRLRANAPPTLIFYSKRDEVVRPSDVERYRQMSDSLDNSLTVLELNVAGHYFPVGEVLDSTLVLSYQFIKEHSLYP